MRIGVTGSGGYPGSLVAPELMRRDYGVIGIDARLLQGSVAIPQWGSVATHYREDLRVLDASDLSGCDGVVHMAELSNDPAGQLSPNNPLRPQFVGWRA
jgi:nucleoside-diphosphate-sugar epimerase